MTCRDRPPTLGGRHAGGAIIRRTREIGTILLSVFALTLLGLTAFAGTDEWFLADQKDKHIRAMISGLVRRLEANEQEYGSGTVTLLSDRSGLVDKGALEDFVNRIYLIRGGDALSADGAFEYTCETGALIGDARAFYISPKDLSEKALKSARIRRVDGEWNRMGASSTEESPIRFEIPALRDGDILGISIRSKLPLRHPFFAYRAALEYPIVHAQRRIKTGHERAFVQMAQGFRPGQAKERIVNKDKYVNVDTYLIATDVDPIFTEPFSPPAWMQTPYFIASEPKIYVENRYSKEVGWWTQRWDRYQSHVPARLKAEWIDAAGWGMAAVEVSTRYRALIEARDSVEHAVSGILSEHLLGEASVRAAYDFVKNELKTLPPEEPSPEGIYTSFDAILLRKSADRLEKALLLKEMIEAMGFEAVDVVWIHDPRYGSFIPSIATLNNVDVPIVRWGTDRRTVWMDASCVECEMGELPDRVYDQPGRWFDLMASKKLDEMEIFDRAFLEAKGGYIEALHVTLVTVENQGWAEMVETPARSRSLAASTRESAEIERDASTGRATMRLTLQASGRSAARAAYVHSTSARSFASEWILSSYPGCQTVEFDDPPRKGEDGGVEFEGIATLSAFPEPVGDEWTLEPWLLMGAGSIGRWPVSRRSDYFVPSTHEQIWELSIPMPPGWESAAIPPPQQYASSHLNYSAAFEIRDGSLTLRRRLHVLGGHVPLGDARMVELSRCAALINAFESTPVVLRRASDTP